MTDPLTFSAPVDLAGLDLPYNHIPAAFPAWASMPFPVTRQSDAYRADPVALPVIGNRIFIVQGTRGDLPRRGRTYDVVDAATLASPPKLANYLRRRDVAGPEATRRCFLGPVTALTEDGGQRYLPQDLIELTNGAGYAQAAVIIDSGIAFWHDRFRTAAGGCRFKAMRYLDFDIAGPANSPFAGLDEGEIAAYCGQADAPNGPAHVSRALGARFPGSHFGPGGAAWPDALWHGTAMADLMAGLPPDAPDTTALFGIELPNAVLRDADGDSLSAIMPLVIESALAITQVFAAKPLVIVLPWGFSAGPQDGRHPVAQAIDAVLSAHPERQVRLLVPTGNQLQDRCHAHLAPVPAGEPAAEVGWDIAPDDFSQNTVEMHLTATPLVQVRIGPPDRPATVVALKASQAVFIARDGQTVGIFLRFADDNGQARLRLTLAPTGWRFAGQRPTPFGRWALSLRPTDDARLWVLRDDRDRVFDSAHPRRGSGLSDPDYIVESPLGAVPLGNDPDAQVLRSGTVSVLTTAAHAISVGATEQVGNLPETPAWYAGRTIDGRAPTLAVCVDRGWPSQGTMAAVNGGRARGPVSGTSAAVAMAGRQMLTL
jgi:hypothetical protein